jgi:hypothetical protein
LGDAQNPTTGLTLIEKASSFSPAYQLREPSALYGDHFGVKKEGIGLEDTYYWKVYDE